MQDVDLGGSPRHHSPYMMRTKAGQPATLHLSFGSGTTRSVSGGMDRTTNGNEERFGVTVETGGTTIDGTTDGSYGLLLSFSWISRSEPG